MEWHEVCEVQHSIKYMKNVFNIQSDVSSLYALIMLWYVDIVSILFALSTIINTS